MERLFDPPEEEPAAEPLDGPLAARMRPRRLEEFVGQEHLLGEGSALRASLESGEPHSMVLYGPPGHRQDDARAARRRARQRGVRGALGGQRGARRGARGDRAGDRAAARRPGDDLLPRRDPPLQQGPAGRAAARGRGGPGHADRGDDGEPLLRGQLRAALARAGLRAAGAGLRRPRGADAARARARRRRGHRGARRGHHVPRRARGRRRADGAQRARAGGHHRAAGRRSRASRSATPRTRCSARPCSTTRPATSTTTTSRPGSSRRAARTPTPRSTTWRRWSRAARTRASSPAG